MFKEAKAVDLFEMFARMRVDGTVLSFEENHLCEEAYNIIVTYFEKEEFGVHLYVPNNFYAVHDAYAQDNYNLVLSSSDDDNQPIQQ